MGILALDISVSETPQYPMTVAAGRESGNGRQGGAGGPENDNGRP
ncbi:hypothetical protein [Tropicimonas sp. IMCC6043]|nr:hypothetical protein [Tropicimonas sp. IMCC6043]